MCVVAFAWNTHPCWRLLLVGNRDEAYARPSAPLARWTDNPAIVGGRDLEAGGTWMGVGDGGRAAVVTNVRDPRASQDGVSRGLLAADFLRAGDGVGAHADALAAHAAEYRPFNLLLFDAHGARFVSNLPQARACVIADGVHGLSNGDLDASWPKVRRATQALQAWLDRGDDDFIALAAAFADTTQAADADLPDTGIGIEMERTLSPLFLRGARYGTRATTVIALAHDASGCIFERRFGPLGADLGQSMLRLGGLRHAR